MERDPVQFLAYELETHLDLVRARLGETLHADPDDLALLPNATTGVNTILRSLDFQPGDEILATDHDYNACLNAIRFICDRTGAKAVVAHIPFPPKSEDDAVAPILAAASPRTKLAVVSHITSPTALVMPIARIVGELASRGIDTLVDGAHAGMVATDLSHLGAAYYTGNLHKWFSAPKGAGFLHVRRDRQAQIRPIVISHGTNSPRRERTRFRLEFDWMGTVDPSAYLAFPAALDFFENLVPGGWLEAGRMNRELVLAARRAIQSAIPPDPAVGTPPESMIGSMASIDLPPDLPPEILSVQADAPPNTTWPEDPLHAWLLKEHRIEVPVYAWPHTQTADNPRRRLLRISAELYNDISQYERLASVLSSLR